MSHLIDRFVFPIHSGPNGLLHGRGFPAARRYCLRETTRGSLTNWLVGLWSGVRILLTERHLLDVDSCINVPVMVGSTMVAGPLALTQGQLTIDASTVRTGLARWLKLPDDSEVLAGPNINISVK